MIVAETRPASGRIASATARLAAAGLTVALATVAACGDDGGAGRIRINANSTDLAGTLSPAADTGLATTGPVRTR